MSNSLAIATHKHADQSTEITIAVNGHVVHTANCPPDEDVNDFLEALMKLDEVKVSIRSMTRPTPAPLQVGRSYDPVVVVVLVLLALGIIVAAACR
jgi:hypothetical protein